LLLFKFLLIKKALKIVFIIQLVNIVALTEGLPVPKIVNFKPKIMNLEKLEVLIKAMSGDQYLKFENAVCNLISDNKLFSKKELQDLDKQIELNKKLEMEKLLVANN